MGRFIRLNEIDVLSRPNCKVREPERVERIINAMINDGHEQLQIATDFDFTLTKQKTDDGKPVLSSFGLFNKSKSLPTSFVEESNRLYKKYRPIEVCPKIALEEKKRLMIEWWLQSADLLKGFSFDMKELDDLASQYSHALRDGTKEMFELTNKLNVPIIVISAGLGDSIKAVMKHERVMYPNVQLVSNFLQHKNGMLDGFSEKQTMIHAFNKNETAMYYENALHRKNIILMGDSLGDADMAQEASTTNVLKIGFLFDHPEENLPTYLSRFDIVLVDDHGQETMDVPRKILSLVAANE